MTQPKTATSPALVMRRTFAAPRDRVFAAWTQAEILKQWFGPPGFRVHAANIDAREGGAYRITVRDTNGNDYSVNGVFLEFRAPERLAYTWCWEQGPCSGAAEEPLDEATLVTLDFLDRGDRTQIVLTHERFPDTSARDRHESGWSGCLDGLATYLGAAGGS